MFANRFKIAFTLAFILCLMAAVSGQTTLKDAFEADFLIGAALNPNQFNERDQKGAELIKKHFNSITAENVMKWERIHPTADRYNFTEADKFVEFGQKNGMTVIGHTLVWHSQTPKWVFEDGKGNPVSRDELLKRMRDHILTVVGRYKGRVKGWDVVNEALNDDGTLRQSPWLKIIGEDYLAKAFEFAREADPEAELYYNDYSLETPAKRSGAIKLVKRLKERNVYITGIGTQGHWSFEYPSVAELEKTLTEFGKLGKVMITELDVDVLPSPEGFSGADISRNFQSQEKLNPYKNGLPAELQKQLTARYAEIFRIFLKHKKDITRVTFWGVTDRDSWKNNFPVRGRTNYPLLFDREGKNKPAFEAVINLKKQE